LFVKTRIAKQWRDKYFYYLNSDLNKKYFEQWENNLINEQYILFGEKWSEIEKFLQGRSVCSIKNR
jgi:hypothetical protein